MIKILLASLLFNQPAPLPPVKVGLVLSGGAALGLVHIGVLKVLEREGIPISAIAGNSMGSVVGGLYAAGYTATQLDSLAKAIDWERLFDNRPPYEAMSLEERETENRYLLTIPRRGLKPELPSGVYQLQNIELLLKNLLAGIEYNTSYSFDSLPIPYRTVAVDLATGEKKIFRSGSLAQAIRASIAIPIVFTPADINDRLYVDGGVVQDLPVDPIKELAPDVIIAVDLSKRSIETPSLIDMIIRTSTIATEKDRREQQALADIVIYPDLGDFYHSDFLKARELIARGEAAAEQALPAIKKLLAGRTPVDRKKIIHPRPLSVVRSMKIKGLKTTKESMVRREIKTKTDSLLEFKKLVADLQRIYQTGLFSHVDYTLVFPTEDSCDITFLCQERIFGTYALGGRFDNINGVQVGFEVAEDNLAGSRLKLGLGATLLNPLSGWGGISGTRLFWFPFNYRLQGYYLETEHSYFETGRWAGDYTDQVFGAEFKTGCNIGSTGYFKFGLEARQVNYEFPDTTLSFHDHERLITPIAEIKFNSYKNLTFPSEGAAFSGRFSYGSKKIASDTNFFKGEIAAAAGMKIFDWLLLEPKIGAGISIGGLPVIEKFKTGSPDFVGYKYEEFLTNQKLTADITSRSLLFHLFGRKNYPIYLELYGDAGTFLDYENLVSWGTVRDSLIWGVGMGLRTNTPVGPLLLKVGVNRERRPNLYLSIGPTISRL